MGLPIGALLINGVLKSESHTQREGRRFSKLKGALAVLEDESQTRCGGR